MGLNIEKKGPLFYDYYHLKKFLFYAKYLGELFFWGWGGGAAYH